MPRLGLGATWNLPSVQQDLHDHARFAGRMVKILECTHGERNHQGKGNVVLFPGSEMATTKRGPSIRCRERLGGLLKYYYRKAA